MSSAREEMGLISEELHTIAERISDLAMDQIRSAMHADDGSAPEEAVQTERRLIRARRAVEKAAAILSPMAGNDMENDDTD